jgi:hypothetical protein
MKRVHVLASKILALISCLSALSLSAQDLLPTPIPRTHPFVGRWRFDIPQLNCFEEYTVRTDGTRLTISGQERNEAEFSISLTPDEAGFYKFVDRIVKNNRMPDCAGSLTPVGDVATNYLIFHRDLNKFLICQKPDRSTCFGPYVRIGGRDA